MTRQTLCEIAVGLLLQFTLKLLFFFHHKVTNFSKFYKLRLKNYTHTQIFHLKYKYRSKKNNNLAVNNRRYPENS